MNGWQPVALAVVASILAPAIMLLLTRWQNREDRRMDLQRQDDVAKRVAEASQAVAAAAVTTNVKLDVIHKLVNSNMTAALQGEFNSTVRERAALIELRESRRDAGKVPSQDTLAAIALADSKIAELTTTLNDRKEPSHV